MKRLAIVAVVIIVFLALIVGGAFVLLPMLDAPLPTLAATAKAISPTQAQSGTQTASTVPANTAQPGDTPVSPVGTLAPTVEVPPQFAPGLTFPTAPDTANLYTQVSQPLTPDSAKQIAEQIGIQGQVYTEQGEGGNPVYIVTDGQARITFISSPFDLYFVTSYTTALNSNGNPLPADQLQTIATDFLKAHNLLPTSFAASQAVQSPNSFNFQPVFDGLPLTQGFNPFIQVTLTSAGDVQSVSYHGPQLAQFGSLPLITAHEAWRKATDPNARGVTFASQSIAPPTTPYQSWTRSYQPDEAVDMTGYLEVLQPVDATQPPFLALNNWPLQGNLTGLADQSSRTIHVVGRVTTDQAGRLFISVDQWEAVSQDNFSVQGQIERNGDQVSLVTNGQRYSLANVPANVPTGVDLSVNGTAIESPDPHFEWWLISNDGGASGGGAANGGGGIFAEISLTPVPPATPDASLLPYKVGDPVTDVQGELGVTIHQNTDGTQTTSYLISVATENSGYILNLTGDVLAGNEKYYYQPVRISGTVTAAHPENNSLDVAVTQIAPVYPDLKVQAWLGTDAIVSLSDKQVDLITTDDGQNFVLDYTLNLPPDANLTTITPAGLKTIFEGYVVPDQTFGNFPVVHIFTTQSGDSLDLATYQLKSAQPPVIQAGAGGVIPANFIVDKIELAYSLQDLTHTTPAAPADCTCRLVQPVWRFLGHTPDNLQYEILVQAVRDEYLK